MATRRNNMFFARGAVYACSTMLQIMDEIKDDAERIQVINEFRNRWQEDMINNYSLDVLNKAKKHADKQQETDSITEAKP